MRMLWGGMEMLEKAHGKSSCPHQQRERGGMVGELSRRKTITRGYAAFDVFEAPCFWIQ